MTLIGLNIEINKSLTLQKKVCYWEKIDKKPPLLTHKPISFDVDIK